VYDPAEPVQDSVEVPLVVVALNATLVGLTVQVSPVNGETVSVRLTVPVKPLRPATVIVDVPAEPARTVTLVGEEDTVKSWTV
jgi:hypothetical protein